VKRIIITWGCIFGIYMRLFIYFVIYCKLLSCAVMKISI
jgi:hypothetical protein